jgi:branched-chain amino acid transport system substrate-binding protein
MLLVVMAIALIVTSLAGCSGKKQPTDEAIKIGMIAPMTGPQQFEGQTEVNAVKMAVDEVNKAGGILGGRMITLISEDDMAKPADGVSAIEKLITKDKVVAIQGAQWSSVSKAIMPVLEKYGVPAVTAISTAPDITEGTLPGKDWIFRVIPHDGLVAGSFANFLKNTLKASKVDVLAVNDDWGRQSTAAIKTEFEKLGGTLPVIEYYTGGETNFLPQLTKIKNDKPDALFLVAQSQDGSMIVKQLKELGWKVPVAGLGAFASDTFISLAKDAAEGVYSLAQYADGVDTAGNKAFVDAWKARYPKSLLPDKYAWGPYTATKVIIKAIEKAGSTDPKKIQEALKTVTYDGITGQIAFDQKHQAHPDVYITQVKNGKAVVVNAVPTK